MIAFVWKGIGRCLMGICFVHGSWYFVDDDVMDLWYPGT